LVRIDQDNTIGYVTKLLGFRYAATFDDDDNYYVGSNQLTVLKKVSTMKALPSYNGLNNLGETPVTLEINGESMTNQEMGADYGIVYADWEGIANTTYLVSVKDTQVFVVRVSPGPYKLWTLSDTNLPEGAPNMARVWGAAWKWGYRGSLYFAADDGLGLWELLSDTVNLELGIAKLKKISLANPTDWNDGFTCGDFFPPVIDIPKHPCKYDLYQSITEGKVSSTSSRTYIRHMKVMGQAETEVDFEIKSSGLLSINACAINPVDGILYCNAQMANGQRIARVGNGTLAFIQQAPAGYAFAGYFDPEGNYWIYAQKGLFLVSGLDGKKAYADYTLPAVSGDVEWTSYLWAGTQQFKSTYPTYSHGAVGADFVIMEEQGKTYLVSIVESEENSVSVVDITGWEKACGGKQFCGTSDEVKLVPGTDGTPFFKSEGLPDPLPGHTTNTWGSAWKTADDAADGAKMLFSRDHGGELYELTGLNLKTKMAKFKPYGKVGDAAWQDGFTCVKELHGFQAPTPEPTPVPTLKPTPVPTLKPTPASCPVESSTTVNYGGYQYRTLTGLQKDHTALRCENRRYTAMPAGYSLVPFSTAIWTHVVKNRPWNTHGMYFTFGEGKPEGVWHTDNRWKGKEITNWPLQRNGNTYKVRPCYLAILIRKPCAT